MPRIPWDWYWELVWEFKKREMKRNVVVGGDIGTDDFLVRVKGTVVYSVLGRVLYL
jgi:hypothetical protein